MGTHEEERRRREVSRSVVITHGPEANFTAYAFDA
jgi:hypothetical protein